MNEGCMFGPESADDRHHPTGRDDADRYLDPELEVSLCHDDHELCHDDLKSSNIEVPRSTPTFLERVALALERLSRFLARLAEAREGGCLGGFLTSLAGASARWAEGLSTTIDALDAGAPTWRTLPGIA
jgi:hypothetical protein